MSTDADSEFDDDIFDEGFAEWPQEKKSSGALWLVLSGLLLLVLGVGGYLGYRTLVPVDYYARAMQALQQEDYASAIVDLKSVLQQNPDDGELRWLMGDAYLKLEQATYAAEYMQEALDLGYQTPHLILSLARAQLLTRDYEAALRLYREWSDVDSLRDSSEWEVIRGRSLLNLGRQERAVDAFFQALRYDPDNTEAKWGLSQAGIGADLSGMSSAEIERALSTGLDEPETWILRGEMELSKGELRDAEESFEQAVELGPENVYALAGLVRVLVATGQLEAAKGPADTLAYRFPTDPMSAYVRALYARQMNEYERALDALNIVLEHEPNHAMSILLLGEVQQAMGNMELAMDNLGLFHRMVPDSVLGRKRFAQVLIETGNNERAVSILEPLVDLVHKDPEIASILATAYARLGDRRRAKAYQSLSFKLDAEGAGARLAVEQMNSGDIASAVRELEAVVEQDPALVENRIMLALSQMRAGDSEAALQTAESILEAQPEDAQVHYLVGTLKELSLEPEAASLHYEDALEKDSNYSPAELALARIDLESGRRRQARDRIEALLERNPKDATAQVWLAQLLMQEGGANEAISRLEAARSDDRGAVQPRLILADIYLRTRNIDAALAVAREINKLAPSNPVGRYLLANAYVLSGDFLGGLNIMSELEKEEPNNLRLKWRMLAAQEQAGDETATLATLQRILAVDYRNQRATLKLAMLERNRGNVREATRLAGELVEFHPESPMGYLVQGQLLMDDGNDLLASDFLGKAYALDADSVVVSRYYMALSGAGEYEKSEAIVADWLDDNPTDSVVRLAIAEEAKRLGDHRRAMREYEWVSRTEPNNVPVLVLLANAYHRVDDRRDLKTAQRAFELAPDNAYAKHLYAWLLVDTGLAERGASLLREVVRQAPNNPTFLYHYAVALFESGEEGDAKDVLQSLANAKSEFGEADEAQKLMDKLGVVPEMED